MLQRYCPTGSPLPLSVPSHPPYPHPQYPTTPYPHSPYPTLLTVCVGQSRVTEALSDGSHPTPTLQPYTTPPLPTLPYPHPPPPTLTHPTLPSSQFAPVNPVLQRHCPTGPTLPLPYNPTLPHPYLPFPTLNTVPSPTPTHPHPPHPTFLAVVAGESRVTEALSDGSSVYNDPYTRPTSVTPRRTDLSTEGATSNRNIQGQVRQGISSQRRFILRS